MNFVNLIQLFLAFIFILTINVKAEITNESLEESKHKMTREEAKEQYYLARHLDHPSLDPKLILKQASLFVKPEEALFQADGLPNVSKKIKPSFDQEVLLQNQQETSKNQLKPDELKLRSGNKFVKKNVEVKKSSKSAKKLKKFYKETEEKKETKTEATSHLSKHEKKNKTKKKNENENISLKDPINDHKRSKLTKFDVESKKSQNSNKRSKFNHKHRSNKYKKHFRKSKNGKKVEKKLKKIEKK